MSHNLRLAFIIIGLAVMGWFIAPTVRWYFFTSEDKKEESNLSLDDMITEGYTKEQIDKVQSYKRLRKESVNMGLDLQGGIRIVLQADFEEYASRLERNVSSLSAEEKNEAMDRLISRLRGRIDQFGVSEVGIRKQGEDRVVVELPGARDPDRIKSVVLSQGALTFNLVDEQATALINSNDMVMGVFTNFAKVPEYGKQLYFYSEKDDFGEEPEVADKSEVLTPTGKIDIDKNKNAQQYDGKKFVSRKYKDEVSGIEFRYEIKIAKLTTQNQGTSLTFTGYKDGKQFSREYIFPGYYQGRGDNYYQANEGGRGVSHRGA